MHVAGSPPGRETVDEGGFVPNPETLPRVLIVTVNPLSATSNNGKTFASFFQGYPSEKLAQLYFHRETPSSDVSDNYYRISDEDVVRFVRGKTTVLGGRVEAETVPDQLLPARVTRALASFRIVRLARAALLRRILSGNHAALSAWLHDLHPELIFFCGGDATYLYPLVESIASDFQAPIVTYVTDDYVLPSATGGPFAWLARRITRRNFLRACDRSALVLTIGDKMSAVYSRHFGVASRPIMNLVTVPDARLPLPPREPGAPVTLCYAGGLHFNRWEILSRVGESLDRLAEEGINARLLVYTATELDSKMTRALGKSRRLHVRGSVGQDALQDVYASSEVLVHVESFGRADWVSTQLSISTKIPEYFASDRCILAVGPPGVASIEYLQATDAAFVATSLDEAALDALLRKVLSDEGLRLSRAAKGLEVAAQNHDAARVRRQLWRDFVEITQEASRGGHGDVSGTR